MKKRITKLPHIWREKKTRITRAAMNCFQFPKLSVLKTSHCSLRELVWSFPKYLVKLHPDFSFTACAHAQNKTEQNTDWGGRQPHSSSRKHSASLSHYISLQKPTISVSWEKALQITKLHLIVLEGANEHSTEIFRIKLCGP